MKLALFDLDHTLLNIDSDHSWGEFLIEHKLVDAKTHRARNDAFYQDYKRGQLDATAYNEFVFEFLARTPLDQLQALRHDYIQQIVIPSIRLLGLKTLDTHRARAHTLVLITATNSFITAPIAEHLGIGHLLASIPEFDGKRYTGHLQGTPCFQAGKLNHLRQWLIAQQVEIDESWGYSDSMNDLPLLEHVTHPHCVNPDDRLLATAQNRRWPILDWAF